MAYIDFLSAVHKITQRDYLARVTDPEYPKAKAAEQAKPEIKRRLQLANATSLPFPDHYFDLVYSLNTLHNLYNYDLEKALREVERVGKKNKYICVESYRNEVEKANLLYWQLTCEEFCTPEEWAWWFEHTGYRGDHSFIYFE